MPSGCWIKARLFAVFNVMPLQSSGLFLGARHIEFLKHRFNGRLYIQRSQGSLQIMTQFDNMLANVITTCRQRGHSPWPYLRAAIADRRVGRPLAPLPASIIQGV
jgi:hypothetical protein